MSTRLRWVSTLGALLLVAHASSGAESSAAPSEAAATPMTQAAYAEYLRRFNAGDDRYAELYDEHVVFARRAQDCPPVLGSSCSGKVPRRTESGREAPAQESDLMTYAAQYRATAAALSFLLLASCGADHGSSEDAKASGNTMTREKYEQYVRLFNAGDRRYAEFYDPNVVFDARPAPQPLHGPQAILDLYDELWKQLDEEITVGAVVIDNEQGLMAVEITNRITATQDDVKLPSRTMNKGDVSVGRGVIIYGLSNGRITHIREARSGRTFTPANP